MTQVHTTYSLRNKHTGALVRYDVTEVHDGYACVPRYVTLRDDQFSEDLPVYEHTSFRKLSIAISKDTPSYNANYDTPRHGDLDVATYDIVKRTISETVNVQVYHPPLGLVSRFQGNKPIGILRRYSGVKDLPDTYRTMELFELPAGETLDTIRARTRSGVFSVGDYRYVVLVAVFEVPEDYVPDLGGKPGFGAIVRDVMEKEVDDLEQARQEAALTLYSGLGEAPAPATWPLPEALWRQFVDREQLVTFTATVPLDTVVRGIDALVEYVAQAFDNQVSLCSPEFLAIGAQSQGWEQQCDGDVVLQVTCTLVRKD